MILIENVFNCHLSRPILSRTIQQTPTSESKSQLQVLTNSLDDSIGEHNSSTINQTTEPTTSIDTSHSSADIVCDTNE